MNQIIVEALKSNLSNIKGVKIFEWLSRPLNEGEEEYPAVILRDPIDRVQEKSMGVESHKLLVEIDIVVAPKTYEAKEIRNLIPKVKDAVRKTTNQDLYLPAQYLGREVIGEHKDFFYIASRLKFEIEFETEKWMDI